MPTTRLNASNVAKLAPRDATYITYDSVVRGFGVRVTPAGARSYILTYRRQDGHQRRMTIGRVDQMQLIDARRVSAPWHSPAPRGPALHALRQMVLDP